jgi:hypothetical protein
VGHRFGTPHNSHLSHTLHFPYKHSRSSTCSQSCLPKRQSNLRSMRSSFSDRSSS